MEFLWIFAIVLGIVFLVLLYCCCKKVKKCRDIVSKLLDKIFWNTILRYSLEKCIKLSLASMAAVKVMNFNSFSEGFSTVYSMLILFIILNMLFGYTAFLHRNKRILRRSRFTKKYGTLTLNLKTK